MHELLLGEAQARAGYVNVLVAALANLASWASMDAWLGAGDDPTLEAPMIASPTTSDHRQHFLGVSQLVQMSSDLASGILRCLDDGLLYPAAALTRQLIECEYLLLVMGDDFDVALDWVQASDVEIRKRFQPKHVRSRLGIAGDEYWTHCGVGGHPSPRGRRLLEFNQLTHALTSHRPMHQLLVVESMIDVINHVERVWLASLRVLDANHARLPGGVPRVAETLQSVDGARNEWERVDIAADLAVALALLQQA